MAIMMIIPIIGFVLVLIMILTAIRNKNNAGPSQARSSRDAMKILDERFARGEIDEAEYIRKKTVLKR
jgi:putative membrane protein